MMSGPEIDPQRPMKLQQWDANEAQATFNTCQNTTSSMSVCIKFHNSLKSIFANSFPQYDISTKYIDGSRGGGRDSGVSERDHHHTKGINGQDSTFPSDRCFV